MQELDEALTRFQMCDVEYAAGAANCGPMAAEALVALGHPALVGGFVDVYAPRLRPLAAGAPIPASERSAALAVRERAADWVATFAEELTARPWRAVLEGAAEDLVDGLFAGRGHAWLRVAHAVRGLEASEGPPRLRELAFGLGYWAAHHQRLPAVPRLDSPPAWHPSGLLTRPPAPIGVGSGSASSLPVDPARSLATRIEADPGAREWMASLGGPGASAPLTGLDELSAGLAVRCRDASGSPSAHVHALGVASALRLVAPHVEGPLLARLHGQVVRVVAAIHLFSAHPAPEPAPRRRSPLGGALPPSSAEYRRLAANLPELRYRAACSMCEPVLLFVEACLREAEVTSDPRLLEAAAAAIVDLDAGPR